MKNYTFLFFILIAFPSIAQDSLTTLDLQASQNKFSPIPGNSKYMIRGYYHAGIQTDISKSGNSSNYTAGSFAPIFLYRQSDKLFFEAELEGSYNNGVFELDLEYADMSYILNKYMTVRAGKFLIPFGTFGEKLHPAWVNKLATKPLGFGHDGITPMSDVGIELRGAFYISALKVNYQVYSINGPRLKTGDIEPDEAGMLNFSFADNNHKKSVGGRIGLFPFSNSMMEIGFSGMTGIVGDKSSIYKGVRANLFAVDISLVKDIAPLKSVIDIKGQYNNSQISNAKYINPENNSGELYSFENKSNSSYAQLAIRPAFVENNIISKLEFVGRYSTLNTPEEALWEKHPRQFVAGINYWLDWRTVIKLGLQSTSGKADHEAQAPEKQQLFYIHWAMGF